MNWWVETAIIPGSSGTGSGAVAAGCVERAGGAEAACGADAWEPLVDDEVDRGATVASAGADVACEDVGDPIVEVEGP